MIPKTLSASAVETYEGCPARYNASYIDRTPELSGAAAGKGTVCHAVLERWVIEGHLDGDFDEMKAILDDEYYKLFTDGSEYQDCLEMLQAWFDRQNWDGRVPLLCEVKETFPLKVDGHVIPFTYIWDRCDELNDGCIEVVDYKTFRLPVQPEELKYKIQPRAYAVAAMARFPDAKGVWVTYDMLRYDTIGVKFTRDECIATYRYLQNLARRILADDGSEERLNPTCRWCVRNGVCDTLQRHADGGGMLGISTPEQAADARARLSYAKSAIESQITELDAYLIEALKETDNMEIVTDETILTIGSRKFRKVESERVAKVIGPDLFAEYAKMGVTEFDKLIKAGGLTPEQVKEIKRYVRPVPGRPSISTKPRTEVVDGLDG